MYIFKFSIYYIFRSVVLVRFEYKNFRKTSYFSQKCFYPN